MKKAILTKGNSGTRVRTKPKSYLLGILLAIVLQPLGLLYATVNGGCIMTLLMLLGYLVFYLSGESPYSFAFFWIQPPVNLTWSLLAIRKHNKSIEKEVNGEKYSTTLYHCI